MTSFDLLELPAVYRPTFPCHVLACRGDLPDDVRGDVTGATRPCGKVAARGLCNGTSYEVRWLSGVTTWPCSRGMVELAGEVPSVWRIVWVGA